VPFDGAPDSGRTYVELTVHAPCSRGADVKDKVFWIAGCRMSQGGLAGRRTRRHALGWELRVGDQACR
jgi:hypothetical protein